MKKIFLFTLLLTTAISISSQDINHIFFKNVEMCYSAQDYIQKLKDSKMILLSSEKNKFQNVYSLQGEFATVEDCTIKIYAHHNDSIVGKAVVLFPVEMNWKSLKAQFMYINGIYTRKYGTPSKQSFIFTSPHHDGDGWEMNGVSEGKCLFYSHWLELSTGVIKLDITKDCRLEITYEDKVNWQEILDSNRKEIEDEI